MDVDRKESSVPESAVPLEKQRTDNDEATAISANKDVSTTPPSSPSNDDKKKKDAKPAKATSPWRNPIQRLRRKKSKSPVKQVHAEKQSSSAGGSLNDAATSTGSKSYIRVPNLNVATTAGSGKNIEAGVHLDDVKPKSRNRTAEGDSVYGKNNDDDEGLLFEPPLIRHFPQHQQQQHSQTTKTTRSYPSLDPTISTTALDRVRTTPRTTSSTSSSSSMASKNNNNSNTTSSDAAAASSVAESQRKVGIKFNHSEVAGTAFGKGNSLTVEGYGNSTNRGGGAGAGKLTAADASSDNVSVLRGNGVVVTMVRTKSIIKQSSNYGSSEFNCSSDDDDDGDETKDEKAFVVTRRKKNVSFNEESIAAAELDCPSGRNRKKKFLDNLVLAMPVILPYLIAIIILIVSCLIQPVDHKSSPRSAVPPSAQFHTVIPSAQQQELSSSVTETISTKTNPTIDFQSPYHDKDEDAVLVTGSWSRMWNSILPSIKVKSSDMDEPEDFVPLPDESVHIPEITNEYRWYQSFWSYFSSSKSLLDHQTDDKDEVQIPDPSQDMTLKTSNTNKRRNVVRRIWKKLFGRKRMNGIQKNA